MRWIVSLDEDYSVALEPPFYLVVGMDLERSYLGYCSGASDVLELARGTELEMEGLMARIRYWSNCNIDAFEGDDFEDKHRQYAELHLSVVLEKFRNLKPAGGESE